VALERERLGVLRDGRLQRADGVVLGDVVVTDDQVDGLERTRRDLRDERLLGQRGHQNDSRTDVTTALAKSLARRSRAFEFWPRNEASFTVVPVVTSYSSLKVWAGFS
jgi:hypothetical protein